MVRGSDILVVLTIELMHWLQIVLPLMVRLPAWRLLGTNLLFGSIM